jgi:6-phosphogluconolactonase
MKQTIFDTDRKKLLTRAAEYIGAELERFANRDIILGLPGGRSAAELFEPLRETLAALKPGTRRALRIYEVDERCVPLSSDESNAFLIDRELIAPLVESEVLSQSQFRAFQYRHDLADWGLERYSDDFVSHGGKFDIAVLGVGEDGHIASLFPHHPAWDGSAGESQFLRVDSAPKAPPRRITASPATLKKSGAAILLFLGEDKRGALEAFRRGEDERACPARIVSESSHLCVVTDLVE